MPRNSSGTMTLPAGNPVVSATTISTTWANTTLGDISTEISDSLSRSGKGGATAPIRTADGTVAAPAHAFTSEPASGLYKAATGDVRLAIGGVDFVTPTGVTFPAGVSGVSTVKTAVANGQVDLIGNRSAADANADVALGSTATRTAGYLLVVQNNVGAGGNKLLVDYNGLLTIGSPATAIQPGSIWTGITPNANWTAGGGLSYWKDVSGVVRLKGTATWATGATNPMATLPAGFRPLSARYFSVANQTTGLTIVAFVGVAGDIGLPFTPTNGHVISFDGVAFLAEA